jgi:hypothetical protein
VPAWQSYSYLFGPLTAFLAVGVLVLLLRWAFSSGGSLVERRPRRGDETDYGMLVAIASPGTYVEGELLRRRLAAAGLRATVAQTTGGPRLMVWAGDEPAARRILAGPLTRPE